MNRHYIRDTDYDGPATPRSFVRPWIAAALLVALLLGAVNAFGEAKLGTWSDANGRWEVERSDSNISTAPSLTECKTKAIEHARAYAANRTSGYAYISCQVVMRVDFVKPAATCPAPPAPRKQTCPAGYTGAGWTQTPTQGAYPSCAVTWSPVSAPAGACTQIPTNTATLHWTPPTQNTDGTPLTNLQSYTIYYGTKADALFKTLPLFVPNATTYRIEDLSKGTWYFGIKAVAATGAESQLSSIVSKVIP